MSKLLDIFADIHFFIILICIFAVKMMHYG